MCDCCVVDDEMEFCEECDFFRKEDGNADNERDNPKRRENTDLRP